MKHIIILTLYLLSVASSLIYGAHIQREEEFHQPSQHMEHEQEVEHKYVATTWRSWVRSVWLRENSAQTEMREQKEALEQLTKHHEQTLQEQALIWADADAKESQRNDATNSVPYLRVQKYLYIDYQAKLEKLLDDIDNEELRKQCNDRIKEVEAMILMLKRKEAHATPLITFTVQQQKSLIVLAYDSVLEKADVNQLADISPEQFLKVAKPFLSAREVIIFETSINQKMGASGFKELGKKLLIKIIDNIKNPLSDKQKKALKSLLQQTYYKALHELIVGGIRIAQGEDVVIVLSEFIGNIFKSLLRGCKILLAPLKERLGNTSLGLWYQKEVIIDDFSKQYTNYVGRESGVADYMKDLWNQLNQKMTIDDQPVDKFSLDERIDMIGRIRNNLVIAQAEVHGVEQEHLSNLDEQLLQFMKNPMFEPGTTRGWFLNAVTSVTSVVASASMAVGQLIQRTATALSLA